jgi:hypothetical protein
VFGVAHFAHFPSHFGLAIGRSRRRCRCELNSGIRIVIVSIIIIIIVIICSHTLIDRSFQNSLFVVRRIVSITLIAFNIVIIIITNPTVVIIIVIVESADREDWIWRRSIVESGRIILTDDTTHFLLISRTTKHLRPELKTRSLAILELVLDVDLVEHVSEKRPLVMLETTFTETLENASDSKIVVKARIQMTIAIAIVLATLQLASGDIFQLDTIEMKHQLNKTKKKTSHQLRFAVMMNVTYFIGFAKASLKNRIGCNCTCFM